MGFDMDKMTPKERFIGILSFEPVDRIPLIDFGYWNETLQLWYEQGLPRDVNTPDKLSEYFGLDRGFERNAIGWYDDVPSGFIKDFYPVFEKKVVEETETTITYESELGITIERKDCNSIPQHIKHIVETMEDFETKVLSHMNARDPGRLQSGFFDLIRISKARNEPIGMTLNGFFAWPRILLGIENQSMFYFDKPELIHAINKNQMQFLMDYIDVALEYTDIDFAWFFEDMAYNSGSFISPDMFDEFMTPYYLKLNTYMKERGIKKILVDSDGDVTCLCQKFQEVGIDGIFPLEVNAGSTPEKMRALYPKMAFMGGIRKSALAEGKEAIDIELSKLPPIVKKGGYIPTLDHFVPPEVTLENYRYYVEQKREILASCIE
ncbi:hypothetical protein AGMMS49983_17660 [Clostridia bacterium]|nr:hypothetical protein AGMMS49983_17660 [Clostridia bacterium]